MTRMRMLIVSTAVAFALPLGAALAQTPGVAPSNVAADQARSQPGTVEDTRSPMQEQAMVPNTAPVTTVCGAHDAVTMRDEFGRSYNCRGDRVR